MKSAPYVAGIAILIVLAVAVGLAFNNKKHDIVPVVATSTVGVIDDSGSQTQTNTGSSQTGTQTGNVVADMIHVTMPANGQSVGNSFELKGEARGTWYFEASFPGKVVDDNGKVLSQFVVSAKGDWMTTNFVPFDQTIKISTSTTATGKLILEKDNPSGLPQNAKQIVIPIKFATTTSA